MFEAERRTASDALATAAEAIRKRLALCGNHRCESELLGLFREEAVLIDRDVVLRHIQYRRGQSGGYAETGWIPALHDIELVVELIRLSQVLRDGLESLALFLGYDRSLQRRLM